MFFNLNSTPCQINLCLVHIKTENFFLCNVSTAAQKSTESKLQFWSVQYEVTCNIKPGNQTWTKAAKEAANIFSLNRASIKSLSQTIKEIPLVPKQEPRCRPSELLLDFCRCFRDFSSIYNSPWICLTAGSVCLKPQVCLIFSFSKSGYNLYFSK